MHIPTLKDLRAARAQAHTALMAECLFLAWTENNFKDAARPRANGETYIPIPGAGGFLPLSKLATWSEARARIQATFDEDVRDYGLREAYILDELHAHDAFQTRDITTTLKALGDAYSRAEVEDIFKAHTT